MLKMFRMKPSSFDLFTIPCGLWEWRNKVIFNLNLNIFFFGGGNYERYMELIFGDFPGHCNTKHIWLSNSYQGSFSRNHFFLY